ncbi:MAG TPA: hypothetical protein VH396_18625 [Chitinophagaceae bacterium]|jgi:hypothetical protein
MTQPKATIKLKFNRQDFEEVYFKNGQGNIFWGQDVRGHFAILLVFAGALVYSVIHSLLTNHLWAVPTIIFFIFLAFAYRYQRQISPILKWKKKVTENLNKLSKFKSHQIILTAESISLLLDEKETTTNWTAFTKAQINEDCISLISTDTLLFPKKSMTEKAYEYLTYFILDKFKTGYNKSNANAELEIS